MDKISLEGLLEYRSRTFRFHPGLNLQDREQAIAFVNERGFIFFWPITGIIFPSLWTAVAGNRPVADVHDDPGHVTWGWKDSLLAQHRWYYGKVLRKKATMISLEISPYFYALSENYGSPEEDYLTLYEQGRLTQEAKAIYEALLDKGPLDTIALRRAARLSSPESEGRYNKAITDLQADFKVLPVGVTQSGAWHYAFAYDIVSRHFPDLLQQAQSISENQARLKLAELYFRSVGAAQGRDLGKLFGWLPIQTQRTIDRLVQHGVIRHGLSMEKQPGEWMAWIDPFLGG
jgi:tetratricopeptide (TPR) repeat protein